MSLVLPVLPVAQALSEGEMLDDVTILRPGAYTIDADGGTLPGSDTEVATVKGRISAKVLQTDVEQITAAALKQGGYSKVAIPRDTDVEGTDRVRVVSLRNGTTEVFTIAELVPLGTFAVHRKLIVQAA